MMSDLNDAFLAMLFPISVLAIAFLFCLSFVIHSLFWTSIPAAVLFCSILALGYKLAGMKGNVLAAIRNWLDERGTRELERLRPPVTLPPKLLCVRVRGDEAYWWLMAVVQLSELPFAICTPVYRAFAVACLLLVPALAILQWDRYMDGSFSSHRVAEYALTHMVFLFAAPLLFARIALWALAVTPFIRARFYGFGDENMLSNLVVRTRATPFPKGFTSESYYRHLKLSQLGRHSLVYADSEVIAKTVEWLASVSKL